MRQFLARARLARNADDPKPDFGYDEVSAPGMSGPAVCGERMRFDLVDLRLFRAVCEAGSITHGAALVHLSLPAASERLRQMEERARLRLLERHHRGVVPTAAGLDLARHARGVLAQMEQLHLDLSGHAKGQRATIRLWANTAACSVLVPQHLGPWLAARPLVDLTLLERSSPDIVRGLAGGFAEIGIVADTTETADLDTLPFAPDRLVALGSSEHPRLQSEEVAFADLLDLPFVGMADGALQTHVERQALQRGHPLKVRLRVRSEEALAGLAADGVGLAILPATTARPFAHRFGLRLTPLSDSFARRQLLLCRQRDAILAPAASQLFAHLAAMADQPG
ncbi:DNA-binding transcriptional regulator, LysR family [Arboricoccus pini]|uniref:DNA-binding transcriptional regulator, LysR family n=1 Tax=Arboricoccus pini TaxID=1963835 RepID=A0A212RXA7_9PROT|nr:LysR family transcriptional regulator [Arboricoccus pini]SNB77414.1 DNA-binding transcriptional regulator, LysR family [Arboricoccus pini]